MYSLRLVLCKYVPLESAVVGILVLAGTFLMLRNMFAVLLLANIFYPLQGLFNLMVYLRPRYLHKSARQDESTAGKIVGIERKLSGCS